MAKLKEFWPILICMVTATMVILTRDSSIVLPFEQRFYDLRLCLLSTREIPSENIVVIGVDDQSLSRLEPAVGRWPWPRAVFAGLVDFCSNAKTIAFDILFSEADSYYTSSDDLFVDEVKKQREKVVFALYLSNQTLTNPLPIEIENFALSESLDGYSPLMGFYSALVPYPDLIAVAGGLGHVNYAKDSDGVLRSYVLMSRLGDRMYPSLALAAAMRYRNISPKELKFEKHGLPQITSEAFGPYDKLRFIPMSKRHKTYSIADILDAWQDVTKGKQPTISRSEFKGKIVLIGSLATGLLADRHMTSGVGNLPGIYTEAVVLDNLLNGKFLKVTPDIGEIFLIVFLSFLPLISTVKRPRSMIFAVLSLSFIYIVVVIGCLFAFKLMLPVTAPFLGLFVSSVALGVGYWYAEISHRKSLEVDLREAYQNLQITNERLEGYSRTLEGKVEQRTSEIKEKNIELEGEIAERKRIEKALLKQAEALADANTKLTTISRHKDRFFANMSHELRTPLNAILGAAELLNEGIQGAMNAKQLNTVRMISDSGEHLLSLINDILDLAKIEEGKIEFHIRPVSIMSVCETSLRFIKQLAEKKAIDVIFTHNIEDGSLLQTDERRLKQVLVNLLSNAVKFTPENGQVGLDVVGDAELKQVNFIVWDTGIGIQEKDRERLFQPFVQLDSSLKRQHEGTGLGLSLVDRLTKMLGGRVSLESKVGSGSRFIVSFPWNENDKLITGNKNLAIEQVAKHSQPQRTPTDIKKPKTNILLAEDNYATGETIREYLQSNGYGVTLARDGIAALDQASKLLPDIILMDVQMPNMDGLEAMRRLRSDKKFSNVPIVALTARAMPEDLEKCLTAGANRYVSKPVRLHKLLGIIEEQLKIQTNESIELRE